MYIDTSSYPRSVVVVYVCCTSMAWSQATSRVPNLSSPNKIQQMTHKNRLQSLPQPSA